MPGQSANPSSRQTDLDLAVQHQTAGRLAEAEGIYRQILAIDPNQVDAVHLLGVISYQVGKNNLLLLRDL